MVERDRERLERESVIWWRDIERDWRERLLYGGERLERGSAQRR